MRQVARQIAEDVHLEGFTLEEEHILPQNPPLHAKTQYVTVRYMPCCGRACTPCHSQLLYSLTCIVDLHFWCARSRLPMVLLTHVMRCRRATCCFTFGVLTSVSTSASKTQGATRSSRRGCAHTPPLRGTSWMAAATSILALHLPSCDRRAERFRAAPRSLTP